MGVVRTVFLLLGVFITCRATIVAENLALRHQLGVLQRSVKRPRLRQRDRILWVWLSRFWANWRSCLIIVKPDTVVRWHRDGFRLYWRWKSRGKPGRPKIGAEIRRLIRGMSGDNATWGSPWIQSELALLGYTVDLSLSAMSVLLVSGPITRRLCPPGVPEVSGRRAVRGWVAT